MANAGLGNVLRRMLFRPTGADPASDRQLLERFAAGRDEAAFAELVRRHGPMVLGACQRVLPDPNDCHDAFQAAFLVLMRKAGSAGWHDSIAGWLHRVAFRAALKIKASAHRRRIHETQAATMAPSIHTNPSWNELRGVLDRELELLPEKYRTPLVLCYIEGKTNEEAAKALGWPAGSMSRRLDKGRELLRARLARRGVTLTGAALAALVTPQAATAAVPAVLAEATVKAAVGLTPASGAAVLAANAIIKDMFLLPLKVAAAVVLGLGLAGGGAAMLLHQAGDTPPTATAPSEAPLRIRHQVLRLPHEQVAVSALAVSPDGRHLASGGSDNILRIWSIAEGRELHHALAPHGQELTWVGFYRDSRHLASFSHGDAALRWWGLPALREYRQVGLGKAANLLAMSADGKHLAVRQADGRVVVLEVGTDQVRQVMPPIDGPSSVAFSPDQRTLAVAGGPGVALWSLTDRQQGRHWAVPGCRALAFAADGRSLATVSPGLVQLWDVDTGMEMQGIGGQPDFRRVAISPDGRLLAAAAARGLHVFDLASLKERYQHSVDLNPHCPLLFAPAGSFLAGGDTHGAIHLWHIDAGDQN